MSLSTLMVVEMLEMQFLTWMINITGGLSFLVALEVVVTAVVVIVDEMILT